MKTFLKNLPFWPVTLAVAAVIGLVVWLAPEGPARIIPVVIVIALWGAVIFAHSGTDKPNQPRT